MNFQFYRFFKKLFFFLARFQQNRQIKCNSLFAQDVQAQIQRAPPTEAELRQAAREMGIDEEEMLASYAAMVSFFFFL